MPVQQRSQHTAIDIRHAGIKMHRTSDRNDGAEFGRHPVVAARRRTVQDVDQALAGVARIDDVIDAEALGGAQRIDVVRGCRR